MKLHQRINSTRATLYDKRKKTEQKDLFFFSEPSMSYQVIATLQPEKNTSDRADGPQL